MTPRRALMLFFALVLLPAFAIVTQPSCAALTAQDEITVGNDAKTMTKCEALGRACHVDGGTRCYGAYRACMQDGGL